MDGVLDEPLDVEGDPFGSVDDDDDAVAQPIRRRHLVRKVDVALRERKERCDSSERVREGGCERFREWRRETYPVCRRD